MSAKQQQQNSHGEGTVEGMNTLVLAGLTLVGGIFIAVLVMLFTRQRSSSNKSSNDGGAEASRTASGTTAEGQNSKKKEKSAPPKRRADGRGANFTHAWLACALKAHSGPVLAMDFSPDGKYLATCSEDRTVHLWRVKEFSQKEHRSVRANVELDHVTKVRFSPDSKAFIGSLSFGETVRVFKIGKKEDGTPGNVQAAYDFPQKHAVEVINIGIASTGRYIMTCCRDTTLRIWDLKGELLATVDSRQMNHTHGAVSPCGRFVASSGFTPDVKVWEVCFDKSGSFREVIRAFELKGHSASVLCFSFSSDSYRMASVSKDGTWRLWNTNVEYRKSQDPYVLQSWVYDVGGGGGGGSTLIALAPDARSAVLASGLRLSVYSTALPDCQLSLDDVHSGEIVALDFSIDSRYFVTAGDKHVNVFHNVVGLQATADELKTRLKAATTQALRERLQQQIDEALEMVKMIRAKEKL